MEGGTMTAFKQELLAAGWVKSPNNIHSLPEIEKGGGSPVWYPGIVCMPCPNPGEDVQVCDDRLRVFKLEFFGVSYSKRSFLDTVTVAVFVTVAELLAYCKSTGHRVIVGGANVWD